jgi:hypothetical protein
MDNLSLVVRCSEITVAGATGSEQIAAKALAEALQEARYGDSDGTGAILVKRNS